MRSKAPRLHRKHADPMLTHDGQAILEVRAPNPMPITYARRLTGQQRTPQADRQLSFGLAFVERLESEGYLRVGATGEVPACEVH